MYALNYGVNIVTQFSYPLEARATGIETVHQDLALIELMNIMRNFFLGRKPTKRVSPFKFLDRKRVYGGFYLVESVLR